MRPSVAMGWLATVVLTLATPALGQTQSAPPLEYRQIVRNYGPDEGFSQGTINALLQGQDGYLWIGTFGGLARFDGTTFTLMRAQYGPGASGTRDDAGGPSSDRILSLREDSRGRLWIGTEDGGLSVYDHGRFVHLPVCAGRCRVFALSRQVGETMWAGTDAGLIRIATDTLAAEIFRRQPAYALAVANDGSLYVGESDAGIEKVVGDRVAPVALPKGVTRTQHIMAAAGSIWAVADKALYRLDPAAGAWAKVRIADVWRTVESQDGRLWVVTEKGELLRTDAAGTLRAIEGVPALYANALWRDQTGVLWVGTNNTGLWSVETSRASMLESPQAAFPGSGRAIVGDGGGGVWLGYGCGGVYRLSADGTYESQDGFDEGLCVSSLLRDTEGQLWIGTFNGGVFRPDAGGLSVLPGTAGLSSVQLWQDDEGRRWLSGDGRTFNLLPGADGAYRLSEPIAALAGMDIRKMMTARKGGIWFIGAHGAVRFDNGKIVERWTPEEGLSSRFARALYEDDRGVIWIGTYGGGLNRIENGRITHYNQGNGLFDDTVSCILADRAGHMWLGGNRGISVLPAASQLTQNIETVPFAVSTSAVTFELNGGMQSSCHQDAGGRLWFSLVSGFARVDPAKWADVVAVRPSTHIERVVVGGKPHDPRAPLSLGPGSQPLEIGYTAINLAHADQLSFRYRIGNADTPWTAAGTARSLIIYDVPWGEHEFEVQARNQGGAWSPAATLRISRPVPWYRYQWLWPLIAFVAMLALLWRTREAAHAPPRDARMKRLSTPAEPAQPREPTSLL